MAPDIVPSPPGADVSAETTDLVKAVAEGWNLARLNYAVANGLEDYPQNLGRDLDVVVERQHLEAASVITRSTLEHRGWRVAVQRYPEVTQHFGIGPSGTDLLVIDLFPGLRWGPVWLVQDPAASYDIDGFRIDPWVTFVKRILLHTLVAPARKFSASPDHLQLSDAERGAAAARLPRLVGTARADRLLSTLERKDIAGLELLRPEIRRALIVSALRSAPLRAARTAMQWAAARVTFATTRSLMPTIAVVGRNGAARTAVVDEIARQAQQRLRCPYVAIRRGGAGVLPQLAPTSRPGALRDAYRAVDFGLTYLLRDRRVGVDLGLVVYEVDDPQIDGARRRLFSHWAVELLLRVLPQPDLVVMLYDATEVGGDVLLRKGANRMALRMDSDPHSTAARIVDRLVDLFLRTERGLNGTTIRNGIEPR